MLPSTSDIAAGGQLLQRNILRTDDSKPWWVYTLNIDKDSETITCPYVSANGDFMSDGMEVSDVKNTDYVAYVRPLVMLNKEIESVSKCGIGSKVNMFGRTFVKISNEDNIFLDTNTTGVAVPVFRQNKQVQDRLQSEDIFSADGTAVNAQLNDYVKRLSIAKKNRVVVVDTMLAESVIKKSLSKPIYESAKQRKRGSLLKEANVFTRSGKSVPAKNFYALLAVNGITSDVIKAMNKVTENDKGWTMDILKDIYSGLDFGLSLDEVINELDDNSKKVITAARDIDTISKIKSDNTLEKKKRKSLTLISL